MDMADTLVGKADQIGADDLISGQRTITITGVKINGDDQPVRIFTKEFGDARPFKPCLTMRRLLTALWGPDSSVYVGRRITIYRDSDVTFGNDKPGGVRISHLSHIDKTTTIWLKIKKGKSKPFTVDPLPDPSPPQPAGQKQPTAGGVINGFESMKVTAAQLEVKIGRPQAEWTAEDIAKLAALGKAIKAGETTPHEEFEQAGEPQQGELGQDGAE